MIFLLCSTATDRHSALVSIRIKKMNKKYSSVIMRESRFSNLLFNLNFVARVLSYIRVPSTLTLGGIYSSQSISSLLFDSWVIRKLDNHPSQDQ